jgi:hypothetical protein
MRQGPVCAPALLPIGHANLLGEPSIPQVARRVKRKFGCRNWQKRFVLSSNYALRKDLALFFWQTGGWEYLDGGDLLR